MSKRETIMRYSLIIQRLRKRPSTFAEIQNYLQKESEFQDYNFNVSQRTFQRDVEDIRSIYKIDIQYDTSRKAYIIVDDETNSVQSRILGAFDLFNALNISEKLSDYIYFEKRQPQGTENLYSILNAIKDRKIITFDYYKFEDDDTTQRRVAPYALKEFKYRWYIVAKDLKAEQVKIFALDRISSLETTRNVFLYPEDFQVSDYFKYSFGITVGNKSDTPQEIILSFNALQGKYVKTLPLHESQQIILDAPNELQIKLQLKINIDFIIELLSFGANVKVLQPASLAQQLMQTVQNMQMLYQK